MRQPIADLAIRKKFSWLVLAIVVLAVIVWVANNDFNQTIADKVKPTTLTSNADKDRVHKIKQAPELLIEIKKHFPIATYKKQLLLQLQQIEKNFVNADLVERIILERELALQKIKIDEHKKFYADTVTLLLNVYLSIQNFQKILPTLNYINTYSTLIKGDTGPASNLLSKVESNYRLARKTIELEYAAEAAFQQGSIAENRNNYRKAHRHYSRAVKYEPTNIHFLITAGLLADSIALYSKAIDLYEAALYQQIKIDGKSTQVRMLWNKLGGAWNSKGDYDKAIEYFDIALADDNKTFGPSHPNIVTDKNYLGAAWENKGNYAMALKYYQQAYTLSKSILGLSHPTTVLISENIDKLKLTSSNKN